MLKKTTGIDLGTTGACVVRPARSDSVRFETERVPTAIAFTTPDRHYVGEQVTLASKIGTPSRVVTGLPRLLYEHLSGQVSSTLASWLPYKIVSQGGQSALHLKEPRSGTEWTLSLHELAALFFGRLSIPIRKNHPVILTVPACYGGVLRSLLTSAARQAGINLQAIWDAPTALSAVYASEKRFVDKTVALCDLGGGKFEATIVYFGPAGTFHILSTAGNPQLGGLDFDVRIAEWILSLLSLAHPDIDWRNAPHVRARILTEATTLKHILSTETEADVQLPFLSQLDDGTLFHFPNAEALSLSRETFVELIRDLLASIESTCRAAIASAPLNDGIHDIDSVVLLGGQATMPALQRSINRAFGRIAAIQPDSKTWLAYGAALIGEANHMGDPIFAPFDADDGRRMVDWMRCTERQRWPTVLELAARYPPLIPCYAQHGQDFERFVDFVRRAELEHILDAGPDFLIPVYEQGAQILRHLDPASRRALLDQLYQARDQFAEIPVDDLSPVIAAAASGSIAEVLKAYRHHGRAALDRWNRPHSFLSTLRRFFGE